MNPRGGILFKPESIFLIFLLSCSSAFAQIPISPGSDTILYRLYTASEAGLIDVTIRGAFEPDKWAEMINMDGIHYGKCLILALENTSDTILQIMIPAGELLIPDDSTVQNMLVTHEVNVVLRPGNFIPLRIYAMCAEMHDAAPDFKTFFTPGPMADNNLIRLAIYLEKHYHQNLAGQHALWALSNDATVEELMAAGADSISILISKTILDSSFIYTVINPFQSPVTEKVVESNNWSINKYFILAGGAIILFLIVLLIRMKSNSTNA